MKQSVTVAAQVLWSGRYGCDNGRYGCAIVMSYTEINIAVSQWLLSFNLWVSVTWPLTCAFHILGTQTPEIVDMDRGVCDKVLKRQIQFAFAETKPMGNALLCYLLFIYCYLVKILNVWRTSLLPFDIIIPMWSQGLNQLRVLSKIAPHNLRFSTT